MAAVITSTDSPEAVKTSLEGRKMNVQVHDDAGNDVTVVGTGVVSTDQDKKDDIVDVDKKDDAAPEEGTSTDDSAASGKEKEPKDELDSKFQRRIDGLISKLGELEGKLAAATAPKEPVKDDKPKADAEPQPEDFDTQADFLKSLSRWAAKEARKEAKVDQDKEAAATRKNEVMANWTAQVEAGKKNHKDWNDVMTEGVVIGPVAANTLMQLPDGAEIAYYIGKNPDEAKKLTSLKNDREIMVSIGELRAKVKAANPESKKDETAKGGKEKPKPITPLGGTSSGNVDKKAQDMTYQEFKAKRNQDLAKQRRSA